MSETTSQTVTSATSAATPAASSATGDAGRSRTMQAVDGPGETVAGGSLLVAAYAVVWVIVLLVVVRVFYRQSAIGTEIAALRLRIDRSKGDRGAAP